MSIKSSFYSMYENSSKVHLINHFKSLKNACEIHQIHPEIKFETFEITLHFENKSIFLYPQFLILINDKPAYTAHFSEEVVCFTGWRPYKTITHRFFQQKLQIKELVKKQGFHVPPYYFNSRFILHPVIIKSDWGSFGENMKGPFHPHQLTPITLLQNEFFEEFIEGDILKIGYWNDESIYIEKQEMPYFIGDGKRTIKEIAEERALRRHRQINEAQLNMILAYQNFKINDILSKKKRILADFRYESDFVECLSIPEMVLPNERFENINFILNDLGTYFYQLFQENNIDHIFYTIDAILDSNNQLWFLEVNTNPTVHPYAYESMLHTLKKIEI